MSAHSSSQTQQAGRARKPVEVPAGGADVSNSHSSPTSQRLQRLLRLLALLQAKRGTTAGSLADALGVSRRTVFRDMKVLHDAEVPVRSVPGRGYILDPDFQAAMQDFGASEMMGLMLLSKVAEALPEQPLLRPAHTAVTKIIARLPSTVRGFYQELLTNVTFSPGAARMDPEVPARFCTLQRCIEEHTICEVLYRPVAPHTEFTGRIHPLHLHFHKHSWYLLAFSEVHDEVRMFNLSRFAELTVTDVIFPPMPFSIESYLGNAWGIIPGSETYDVVIRFTPRVTRNVIEIDWHHSQQATEHEDGSCTVRFRVDGLDEIKWWIIGYGDQFEVIEPAQLRDEIAEMAKSILKNNNGAVTRNNRR